MQTIAPMSGDTMARRSLQRGHGASSSSSEPVPLVDRVHRDPTVSADARSANRPDGLSLSQKPRTLRLSGKAGASRRARARRGVLISMPGKPGRAEGTPAAPGVCRRRASRPLPRTYVLILRPLRAPSASAAEGLRGGKPNGGANETTARRSCRRPACLSRLRCEGPWRGVVPEFAGSDERSVGAQARVRPYPDPQRQCQLSHLGASTEADRADDAVPHQGDFRTRPPSPEVG